MAPNKIPKIRATKVFHHLKILLTLSGLYTENLTKTHSTLLVLSIFTPNVYLTVCLVWLQFELKFDTKMLAQSFAVFISGIQGLSVYAYFLKNKDRVLRALDELQDAVSKRIPHLID